MNEHPDNDRELIQRLNASLDRAAARPDAAVDQALAATRARIRGEAAPARNRRPWVWASGLALAASLAVVMVLPRGPQPVPATPSAPLPTAQVQAAVTAPTEDPDMLDDMDMLMAMSGTGHQQG